MPRILTTPDQQAAVKQRLISIYQRSNETSGEIRVSSLGFSENPRHWRISSKARKGTKYPPSHMSEYQKAANFPVQTWRQTNIHISAVLSPQWIHLHPDLNSMFLADYSRRQYDIIAGIHELPPPAGVDRMELLCVSKHAGQVTVSTRFLFRLTVGDFTATVCESAKFPNKAATLAAHDVFRDIVAKKVAHRLNPSPKANTGKHSESVWGPFSKAVGKIMAT